MCWLLQTEDFLIPRHGETASIDVSVGKNLPRFIDVVKVILEDLEIESVIIAEETKKSPFPLW